MISFGCPILDTKSYRRYAEPGIRLAAEPDSAVLAYAAVGPLARTYNLILDAAAKLDGLEALVLVHAHTEIADPGFSARVRETLRDPDVAVAGCAGGSGGRSIAWWQGTASCAPVVHRYEELGGGELPAFAWAKPGGVPAEVESVDGMLLVLSPWAVRHLRFDEALRRNFGHDADLCRQARQAGRRVVTADLRVIHHHALELVDEMELWVDAHVSFASKWDPGATEDEWKRRARRAEAEREAARAITYSDALINDARIAELERRLAAATGTLAWRATEPLRRANQLRRLLRGYSSSARRISSRDTTD
jgi:hypothetical protein